MSVMRPVRRLARGVLLLALAFTLMGNGGCGPFGQGDYPVFESMSFNGTDYRPASNGQIPDSDLTVIGEATDLQVTYSLVTDLTVLSIRDVDPAAVVAMHWDRASWKATADEPVAPGWNVVLFIAAGGQRLPDTVCRYFPPRDISSPTECQAPVRVTFDGRDYLPVENLENPSEPTPKCGSDAFLFKVTDLIPLAVVDDVDPRLDYGVDVKLDPLARAIRGIDPKEAIVLLRGSGFDARLCLFVNADETAVPFGLCQFVNPERFPPPVASDEGPVDPNAAIDPGAHAPIPAGCVAP